ncbi:tRNA lysidine(34) synthetase TilS [Lachnobacterium bovis]|uniref:tRNA(Ile)-lysidine synthase n=1 Tax=Lachnobacterium bovis DSM 14045 TaxID=1122142 RepID=A0A1H3IJ12_9FIRM|nr:tRNA lysidine(34) synthetase TilS [Lachnobacterium bovis]SDY27690.1 tRNA(Ile)-lysidine synthase [Lachnobacterium bovis DSM 14045]
MINKIKKYIIPNGLIGKDDRIIAAVSGGADSVAMLLILNELKKSLSFYLEVVHVEHGIRGEQSLSDARFVEKLCKNLEIPINIFHVDVINYAKSHGLGEEEAARILRYEKFKKVAFSRAEKSDSVKIAIAHHLEDNTETILFQMARGTGIDGVCGIEPIRHVSKNVYYIRPLLGVSRAEIERFLAEKNQDFCTDSTNSDIQYDRNRIRKNILPQLNQINNQAVLHINETANKLREIRNYFRKEADREYKKIVSIEHDKHGNEVYNININKLSECDIAIAKEVIRTTIISCAKKKKDITNKHVMAVLDLINKQTGRKVLLPYNIQAVVSYETIKVFLKNKVKENKKNVDYKDVRNVIEIKSDFFEKLEELVDGEKLIISLNDGTKSYFSVRLLHASVNPEDLIKKKYTKYLDYDKIKKGFQIRNRRSGDFIVSDSDGHHKKLKSYFIDEKVLASERDHIPLLTQDSEIIWIVGMRIGYSYRISDMTESILEIQYNGGN